MADSPQVRIGQLNLRLPGHDAATGRSVAQRVGQGLADSIPQGVGGHLGALDLRVEVGHGASEREISEAVTAAIGRALTRRRS